MGGLFAETQIDLFGEKLKWQIGIRGDLAQMNEGNIHDTLLIKGRNTDFKILNMTTGAMYQFKDDVSITFNIARASRMPDAKELFMESASTDGKIGRAHV